MSCSSSELVISNGVVIEINAKWSAQPSFKGSPSSNYSGFNVQLRPLTEQWTAIVAAVLQTLGFPVQEYLSALIVSVAVENS
jgi:hypothetical protein